MSIHTLYPGFRLPDFFSQTNIDFISHKITEILSLEYKTKVVVPDDAILSEMQIQHEDRLETIAKMNMRVVMEMVRSFRNYQTEITKKSYWSQNFWNSYNYSPSLKIKQFDTPKLNSRARGLRFASTF